MSLKSSTIIGLEQIQREAFFVLFDGLNDAIDQVQADMDGSDQDFATKTGRDYEELTIEHIAPSEFYEGHRPSLVTSPIENYPNCSVWAASARVSNESEYMDHTDIFLNELYVEVMVKSTPTEAESVVNRRCIRTAEAAHFCLLNNPSLNGIVTAFTAMPTVNLSEVFKRQESTGYGEEWYWQAARLDYLILKEANKPSNSSINLDYPSIDQA
jgi:hypothetical protein